MDFLAYLEKITPQAVSLAEVEALLQESLTWLLSLETKNFAASEEQKALLGQVETKLQELLEGVCETLRIDPVHLEALLEEKERFSEEEWKNMERIKQAFLSYRKSPVKKNKPQGRIPG